jgi:caspase domain-containing protein
MKPRDLVYGLCLTAGLLFTTAAAADRRVALVIGNSAYKNASTLANTINDSTAISNLFKSVGFEVVISRNDLGVVDFKRAVREFLLTAETADIAVVYYAGHGIEIGGNNYLVPVDARLGRDYDVDDEAVSLERIIWALQPVKRLRLILLDACRDNPFPAKIRSAGITRATVSGGLAKIEDVSADTLVAFAAKAGSTSYDGDGVNSPYATALLKHLAEPGLDIRIALGRVRDEVLNMTRGRQEPFIYGSLGGATIPLVPLSAAKKPEPAPMPPAVVAKREPAPAIQPSPTVAPVKPGPIASPAPAPAAVPPSVALAPAKPNPPAAPPPAKPAPTTLAAVEADPAAACSRDEQRLARLRSEPAPDEIAKFQRELSCVRLKAQVQRLFESIANSTEPRPAAVPSDNDAKAAARQQAQGQPISAEDACLRDASRLASLRADPSIDAIKKFERELGCEHIRPQLQRLRESLGG